MRFIEIGLIIFQKPYTTQEHQKINYTQILIKHYINIYNSY